MGDFIFWISLSLRPLLSPKYGLRPKISEKWTWFFSFRLSDRWVRSLLSAITQWITETKLWTRRSLKHQLIRTCHIMPYWFYMEEVC